MMGSDDRTAAITSTFARITAQLEDLHGVAVEGQDEANPLELHQALAAELGRGIAALKHLHAGLMEVMPAQ